MLVLSSLILSCDKDNKEQLCYVAFYNYSDHGDMSFCEIEIILPIPLSETKSGDYDDDKKIYGAELITNTDTISLRYIRSSAQKRFFNRVKLGLKDSLYSSYILSMPDPYKHTSLFQADSIFLSTLKNVKAIRYIDVNDVFHDVSNVKFDYYYLFNGRQISKDSKEYFQKMHFELPPRLTKDLIEKYKK